MALDRTERVRVNKLAAILRIANALDAEHVQKVRDVRVTPSDGAWLLEVTGLGDLAMERAEVQARAGPLPGGVRPRRSRGAARGSRREQAAVRRRGGTHRRAQRERSPELFFNRELSWLGLQRACGGGGGRSVEPAPRTREVRGDRGVEPRRVLHGARGEPEARRRGGRPRAGLLGPGARAAASPGLGPRPCAGVHASTAWSRMPSCRRSRLTASGSSACRTSTTPARAALGAFFREDVLPVLTPLAVDTSRPFPMLSLAERQPRGAPRAGRGRVGGAHRRRAGAVRACRAWSG